MKIFIRLNIEDNDKEYLKHALTGHDVFFAYDHPEATHQKEFSEADVAFGVIEPTWITPAINTKWIQLNSVGFDQFLSLDWRKLSENITVTNVAGLFSVPVAETTMAGILALKRGIDRLSIFKEHKKWLGSEFRPELGLVNGNRVVMAGGGSIGQTIRKILEGFGCSVRTFDKYQPGVEIDTIEGFEEALPEADLLIICLPDTPETKHLLNKARIDMLSSSSIVANVGRGGVVDEPSLVDALNNHSIGGAVLDVTWQEPLPEDHPLWMCPNTIITQHTGGGTCDEQRRKIDVFLGNFRRYAQNEPLQFIVDFSRGY